MAGSHRVDPTPQNRRITTGRSATPLIHLADHDCPAGWQNWQQVSAGLSAAVNTANIQKAGQ